MNARELFQAGKLNEAVQALSAEVRDNPSDAKRRTFLFELLCFAGEYDRADKQLDVLAGDGPTAEMGTLLYRGALNAERVRQDLFKKKEYPKPVADSSEAPPISGTLNGQGFQSLSDADPRIGPKLEVFVAGTYVWIPFQHIASIEVQAPRRLRDLLWAPAVVRGAPTLKRADLGEVFLPALSPFSWQHPDDAVRLGRATVWEEDEDGEVVPIGQKMLRMDEEEFPLLELRKLEIAAAQAAS